MHTTTPTAALGALALALALGSSVSQAAMFEPPGSQVLMGSWIDTQQGYEDTPELTNERIGRLLPVYQIAQEIPLPAYDWVTGAGGPAPERLIEESASTAAVFLTVYPNQGFDVVLDEDLVNLGNQINDYMKLHNRTCFLRYAPEMQGTWNEYGFQPAAFVTQWQRAYNAIKAIAPDVIMVWAPNTAQSYPYGESLSDSSLTQADINALDTNGDGTLTIADDAFEPYYPGDDYVDWIGLSLYYKGPDTTSNINVVQPDGYCGQVIDGLNPNDGQAITPFYSTYCEQKPDKACMFAESGAAFHVNNSATGASQLALQQAWIDGCITNSSLYDTYPRLKLNMHFEYEKMEYDGQIPDLRDYRVTNDSQVLEYFRGEIASIEDTYFSWAQTSAVPTSLSSAPFPFSFRSNS